MTRRILVINSEDASRTVMAARLVSGCYVCTFALDAEAAILAARRECPDLILIDSAAPQAALRRLQRDMRLRDTPVVVMAAGDEARLPLLQAGAADVLVQPVAEALLLARLRALLRLHQQNGDIEAEGMAEDGGSFEMPATVAFVVDQTDDSVQMRRDLTVHLSDRLVRLTRAEALHARSVPDLFVIDAGLDGPGAGLGLMSDLRAQAETRNVPICVLQSRQDADAAAMAWDLGADEVVGPTTGTPELALRLSHLLRMKRRQDRRRASVAQGLRMAMVDHLTGLHNRRFAMPRLETMVNSDMAVLLIDLDRFKSVNDRWGHAAGDTVLAEIARRLTAPLPAGALAARMGGEEFLIALPDTLLAGAVPLAENLCRQIAGAPIVLPSGETLTVTISVGLATRRRMETESMADTLERADQALLQSKGAGRNRVTIAAAPAGWVARSA
ncbi:diguanylate cyclase [Falsirhodobacter deserti]|uniref:diguanylate cyclase n=1 Tax=Falsirhodobacter deserti TaxID=1365611 RepID=UPI0013E2FAB2|nr:diguanylate cyclase [Falsirhodobacter deserti]